MIKNLKPGFLLLLLLTLLQVTFAQNQSTVPDYLRQKFLRYIDLYPREEIFVHSDREDYIAGENLWFNLYLIDRQSLKPGESSGMAYFELLNQENRPIIQKRIKLDNGSGPGQVIIPDTLSSGVYTIRAYTSWMKNFLPWNCFMKDIRIYNPFSKKAFTGKSYSEIIPGKGDSPNINDKLTDNEVTLKINNLNPDILQLNVGTNDKYRTDNNNVFYLFIQTHGIIDQVRTEKAISDETQIMIPRKALNHGINQITVFNSTGEPQCERYIYTPDSDDMLFSVSTSGSFKPRSKVNLEIDIDNSLVKQVDASNISVSVSPAISSQEFTELKDYMIFGSEFGMLPWQVFSGSVIREFPSDVIDSLLLTVKSSWIKWNEILSENLPLPVYKPERKTHNLTGKLINRDPLASDSGKFVFMSTPSKDAQFQYAKTDVNASFRFTVNIDEMVNDLVIQPADANKSIAVKIESPFAESYMPSKRFSDSIYTIIPPDISKLIVNYQVGKIYETSSLGDPLAVVITKQTPVRFYGKPDIELVMKDYIKLPVMEEVFFELIPGAFLKNKKSGWEITVSDPIENKVYETPPVLMIDGVIIKDPSLIADIDPETVERIEVVKERYFVGDYLFYGIINVITNAGDYSYAELPDYATRFQYRVVDPVRRFIAPDYSTSENLKSRMPDFRNTLYWNPSVEPDKDGKVRIEFWTSDFIVDYEINIEGVTPDGKFISVKKNIKVE